nr:hypothetical protein [Tanacetum cinerariifolium]
GWRTSASVSMSCWCWPRPRPKLAATPASGALGRGAYGSRKNSAATLPSARRARCRAAGCGTRLAALSLSALAGRCSGAGFALPGRHPGPRHQSLSEREHRAPDHLALPPSALRAGRPGRGV